MMNDDRTIDTILARQQTISFEFFPPKTDEGFASLFGTIEQLRPLEPGYVSVTYGAGGSTRQKTVALVERIIRETSLRAVAHLTCVGHTRAEIAGILDELWENGVRNILALRGDPPAGQAQFVPQDGGFAFASDLVKFIADRHPFCIATAGYPEGHPQCLNRTRDLEYLKLKVDNGAKAIITQLFFDNAEFYRFRDEAIAMGIHVPIIAGIMPISNVSQIKRFVSMCGAKIPHRLLTKLEAVEKNPDDVHKLGVDYAVNQCADLLFNDVCGLHFYTLNKSKSTTEIVHSLKAQSRLP